MVAPFLAIDLAFLFANVLKVFQGGWLPLVVGAGLVAVMWTWRKGSGFLAETIHRERQPLVEFVRSIETGSVQRVPGTAVFLTGSRGDVPGALLHNLKHNRVLHQNNIVLTVETGDTPRVPLHERCTIEKLSGAFSRVTLRFGFMESPHVPRALAAAGFDVEEVSYFLSRRALLASAETGMPLWQDHLFIALARSASDASRYFCIPVDRAVEVGSQISV